MPATSQLVPKGRQARDAAERFQRFLDHGVASLDHLAALAAIDVVGKGRIYFAAGHADIARLEPARSDHLFQIGSQSKSIAAMTALRLHRAALIDLDHPARHYLDLPIDGRITLRHLAMNTSGLGETTSAVPASRVDPRVETTPRDIVALALPQGQLFEPGSRFDYCNTGWVILAMALEAACGTPYAEIVQRHVLEPLALNRTRFGGCIAGAPMLRGYVESEATGAAVDTSACLDWAFGAGDGVSGLDDMLDLFASLMDPNNGLGIGLGDLGALTARPVSEPAFSLSTGAEYGLGIERRWFAGNEVWGHPGSTRSYKTGSWLDAKMGVVVTTCVTRSVRLPESDASQLRYSGPLLFSMALNTAYAMAHDLIP